MTDDGGDAAEYAASGVEIPPEYREREYVETHRPLWRRFVAGVRTDWLRTLSAGFILGVIVVAIFAPEIAPHDPDATFGLFQEPNTYSEMDYDYDGTVERTWHPLGTDSYGHDILSRIIFGTRVSLLVALATVSFAFVVGTTIGLLAGFYGGWIDSLLMRYIDFQWAFPEIVLAIAIIAFSGGIGVWNVIIAIGIAYVDDFARLVRGEVLWIREEEYIKAARSIGMPDRRIMSREILPMSIGPIVVQATVLLPLAILWEASLSFLGLGVKPTTPTWGLLIADGRDFIVEAWWIAMMPGLAIMFTVLAFNIIGDGLRDAFDVHEGEGIER
ncbi:ABC transporter permease [Halovivax cerinus]|uniref:ABC transporter permease n=1 Tax=Halovivax cerinus TaxID=1487865 RepID=A0ABD5NRF3_9EURY|nr:ABC transporter permease [Halovivax cerinus]